MQHTFQVNTSELNSKFIESVKSLFANSNVRIVVERIENSDRKLNNIEAQRFLDHRKNHPSVTVTDQRDFNQIVDEANL